MSTSPTNWTVWRQDDNGNRYRVESGLAEDTARRLTSELESHGHKQLYWMSPDSLADDKSDNDSHTHGI